MASNIGKVDPNDKGMRRSVSILSIFGWIALAIGIVTILFNLSDFSDRNLGLMVGIGFVVGSIFIFIIGKSLGILRKKEEDDGKKY